MNQHQLLSHLPPGPMGGLNHPNKFFNNGYDMLKIISDRSKFRKQELLNLQTIR